MERSAVLPIDTVLPAFVQKGVHVSVMGFAVAFAVNKQHVCALRSGQGDAFEILLNIIAGIGDVFRENLLQLIHPFISFRLIGADQGIHRKHIHGVVMGEGGFLLDSFTQPVIVDDVIAADQSGQVECLARRIERSGMIVRIFIDALCGNMAVAVKKQIAPDLIGDDPDIVLLIDCHRFFKLFLCPDAAAGIVGVAHDGHMDFMINDLLLHVLIIHSPHIVLILIKRGMNDIVSVVFQ